jgi:hypothetical protein
MSDRNMMNRSAAKNESGVGACSGCRCIPAITLYATKPVKVKQPVAMRIDSVREDLFPNASADPMMGIKGPISRPQSTRAGIVSDSEISAIPAIVRNTHTTNSAHKQPTHLAGKWLQSANVNHPFLQGLSV